MHLQPEILGSIPDVSACPRCHPLSCDSSTGKVYLERHMEWPRRGASRQVPTRGWQSLILRSCDKWAKTTLLSPLPATDSPEQIWNKSICQGHTTGWTQKNVQCFYKNMYFLLSYISNTAKITLSIRTEGGTRVGVLDLTLAIIHTNSCPRILTLHNPIYTNMFF